MRDIYFYRKCLVTQILSHFLSRVPGLPLGQILFWSERLRAEEGRKAFVASRQYGVDIQGASGTSGYGPAHLFPLGDTFSQSVTKPSRAWSMVLELRMVFVYTKNRSPGCVFTPASGCSESHISVKSATPLQVPWTSGEGIAPTFPVVFLKRYLPLYSYPCSYEAKLSVSIKQTSSHLPGISHRAN